LTPACAGLLESRKSRLGLLTSTFNFSGSLGLSSAISSQFSVEMCVASKNYEKNPLKPLFGEFMVVQNHHVDESKSLSLVLGMILSSMFVLICNRFHTIRANNSKITSFRGYPSLTFSFERNPAPTGTKFCHDKLESLGKPTV